MTEQLSLPSEKCGITPSELCVELKLLSYLSSVYSSHKWVLPEGKNDLSKRYHTYLKDSYLCIILNLLGRNAMTNLNSTLKSRDITFLTKVCRDKDTVFPVVMYGCESWTIKRAEQRRRFQIVVLEMILWESLEQQGDQTNQSQKKSTLNIHWKDWCWSWSFNTLATWCKEPIIGKDPYAEINWGQEKGATEDEMVGWHHWLNRHEFEQDLGDSEGQGSLACYSSGSGGWGGGECPKESDTT